MTDERTDELIGAVTNVAREISIRLGWRYGDQPAVLDLWQDLRPAGRTARTRTARTRRAKG